VWFGNDDTSEMQKVTGGTLPAMTWQRFMAEALAKAEAAPLAGVPLDDSYARQVAEQEGTTDVRLNRPDEGPTGLASEEEVVITRSPPQSDGVTGIFQNIFGTRSQSQVRTNQVPQRQGSRTRDTRSLDHLESR
jgi:penicillin-binding protein 1A